MHLFEYWWIAVFSIVIWQFGSSTKNNLFSLLNFWPQCNLVGLSESENCTSVLYACMDLHRKIWLFGVQRWDRRYEILTFASHEFPMQTPPEINWHYCDATQRIVKNIARGLFFLFTVVSKTQCTNLLMNYIILLFNIISFGNCPPHNSLWCCRKKEKYFWAVVHSISQAVWPFFTGLNMRYGKTCFECFNSDLSGARTLCIKQEYLLPGVLFLWNHKEKEVSL